MIIQNCEMKDGHGGVVIGSEATEGVENVFSNCTFENVEEDNVIKEVENLIIKNSTVKGQQIEYNNE